MFEFLDSIRIGFFLIGDTVLFVLLLNLISETIDEIKEGDRIEEELKTVFKKREAFYND